MTFVLPNPNTPTNGALGDATPILQNEQAIAQAMNSFDGSQINNKTIVEASLADSINPRLRGLETLANFVYGGCVWSIASGFQGTMTGGTIYVNGYRTIVTGVGSNTFAASSDTYVDIDYLGNITYQSVANNASAPSLTANAIRVAKIITSGSAITTVTQFGSDGIGNIIYPNGSISTLQIQNPIKFRVHQAGTQNVGTAPTIVTFDAKDFDSGNNVDITTNKGRFTITRTGDYFLSSTVQLDSAGSGTNAIGYFYKNGVQSSIGSFPNNQIAGQGNIILITDFLPLGVGDYIEVYVGTSAAAKATVVGSNATYFSGFLVSGS